jgi:hypothetical protein
MWVKVDLGGRNKAAGMPTRYMHIQQSKLKDSGHRASVSRTSMVAPLTSVKITYTDDGVPVVANPQPKEHTIEAPKNVYDIFTK